MKIYNYHPEYKTFVSESFADPSPLDPPGVWLIPAHSTTVKPPDCEINEIQIFNGPSWDIIEDKRGIYYSIETQNIIENNNPIESPNNSTKEVPPEVPEGKKLKWNNGWVLEDFVISQEMQTLSPLEKLQNSGLTIEELRTLLGLTP